MRMIGRLAAASWPGGLIAGVVLLVWAAAASAQPRPAVSSPQDTLIQALFGDVSPSDGLDANGDRAVTVADILVPVLFFGTIADLTPHDVGDQLVYRVTDPQSNVSTETTAVVSADGHGGFVIDDQIVTGQHVDSHQTQSYVDMGTQLLFNGGTDVLADLRTTCNPPLLRLTMPVIAGQTFSTTSRCDVFFIKSGLPVGFINRTDAFTPVGVVDSVTVPAGTYTNVVHFTGSTNLSGDVESDEIYLAPGVGAVLHVATAGGEHTTYELSGGTIGGHPVTP